ncbi:VOC family protein [Streptomyces sp. NPDC050560]|uniref:VOC family protein n=1 Tax=Streptomyces sp. NPDC050560 TaxID=3365630 RepID=UPI0037B177B3
MNTHRAGSATADGTTSTESVLGAPCWVSLTTPDLVAAQEFYAAVFGWRFHRAKWGDEFRVAVSGGVPVAGLGSPQGAPVAWTPYFAVRSADETAARIRERTGTIAVGPLPLATGRGALASDREGAVFGIWEGRLLRHWEAWRTHAGVWMGLRTQDAFAAAIFYGEVLQWAGAHPDACTVEYVADEVVLRSGGHPVARLWSGASPAASDPLDRPRWQVHFRVDDVAECAARATRHGGTVLAPGGAEGGPAGQGATLRDPTGGIFTVDGR